MWLTIFQCWVQHNLTFLFKSRLFLLFECKLFHCRRCVPLCVSRLWAPAETRNLLLSASCLKGELEKHRPLSRANFCNFFFVINFVHCLQLLWSRLPLLNYSCKSWFTARREGGVHGERVSNLYNLIMHALTLNQRYVELLISVVAH